ncbi:MAG: hypothetical protein RIS60_1475, partial [Pseudomonadota bacterium]
MYKNLAAAIAAACFLFPPLSNASDPANSAVKSADAKPVKAAFVYVTPVLEAGWTRQHDEGRKAVEKA